MIFASDAAKRDKAIEQLQLHKTRRDRNLLGRKYLLEKIFGNPLDFNLQRFRRKIGTRQ